MAAATDRIKRMESLFILIPVALIFVALAVKAFFWAVDNKQFDDLESSAQNILFDDDPQSHSSADENTPLDKPDD